MYSDPALIRKHTVKLSLSDREAALLDALCAFTGEQKAVLLREMLLDRAKDVLQGEGNSQPAYVEMPRTAYALQAA
jgi:hypothetical protein